MFPTLVTRPMRFVAVTVVLLCAAAPAQALECPVPHPEATGNVLRETQRQIDRYSSILGGGDMGNAVDEIVTDLRKKHPDATGPEIVNFLVAVYCPALTKQGYAGDAATRKIRTFAALAEARLLKPGETADGPAKQSD